MRIGTDSVVTAILAELEPGREYPYSMVRLQLGFKRVSQQMPELFPHGISFGIPGTFIHSDEVDYAMGTILLSGMRETVYAARGDFVRFTPALCKHCEEHVFERLEEIGISREALRRAAAIVEEALMLSDSELAELTRETLNSRPVQPS